MKAFVTLGLAAMLFAGVTARVFEGNQVRACIGGPEDFNVDQFAQVGRA